MILTDSGPLIALCDRRDPYHNVALETADLLDSDAMVSTWPVLTEAMHLIGRSAGIIGQNSLWSLIWRGNLELRDLDGVGSRRMAQLMSKYADLPMDLADASLVVLAENEGFRRIFSFDHHFRIYRLADGSVLEVLP